MHTEQLTEHQIQVKVANQDGHLTISLSDGQIYTWPINDPTLAPGTFYLTLSAVPILPTKHELAKLVLAEILKIN
ncbi:MAG: hypothetical protein V1807_01895 [Patescibacteria group bacterium]